ncbi:MAG: ATP-binding protein [Actinomycetota bacterium]
MARAATRDDEETPRKSGTQQLRQRVSGFSFRRSAGNRILTGTAGGLAEVTGIDPTVVRMAFVVLSLGSGFGIVLYLFAWAWSDGATDQPQRPRWSLTESPLRQATAVGAICFGLLLVARGTGLWIADSLVWPLALAAFGATLIWVRNDATESPLSGRTPANPIEAVFTTKASLRRTAAGGLFILAGMGALLSANVPLSRAGLVLVPILVTIVGVSLIFGPWLWRLAQQLSDERRERIRSEERSEMAAHLHDSVLQTLALIQRTDDPQKVSSLARVQERELRAWLFGQSKDAASDLLSTAIDTMASRIESLHHVPIEAVVVGDRPMDERLMTMVHACAEATVNAAKHSGANSVAVYVEVEDETITTFVRDSGRGFDPAEVPPDRSGIAESIKGRMERIGGRAEIVSAPGEGTEVRLSLARSV